MKLINPTDDELNAAFAEKVAGWRMLRERVMGDYYIPRWAQPGTPDAANLLCLPRTPPDFTRSMDAVLPWLEKMGMAEIDRMHRQDTGWQWEVKIWEEGKSFFPKSEADDKSLPHACVIALLRANGVEVTFTT